MTELDRTWARSQIEAMADGSLEPNAERRMRALLNCDPELRAEYESAKALVRELKGLADVPVPRHLRRKLSGIPSAERAQYWVPASAFATVAVAALAVSLFFGLRGPTAEELERQATIEDFAITMAYLQKGVMMASNEINSTIGSGVLGVLEMSRGTMDQTELDVSEGAGNDVD